MRQGNKKGSILWLTVGMILLVGIMGGIFFDRVVMATRLVTANSDLRMRIIESVRLSIVCKEAVSAMRESAFPGTDLGLEDELNERLGFLNQGLEEGRHVVVGALPTDIPELADFPSRFLAVPVLTTPSQELIGMASPQLIDLIGDQVSESDSFTFSFTRGSLSLGNEYTRSMEISCRIVSYPITRYSVVDYVLPHEVGADLEGALRAEQVEGPSIFPGGLDRLDTAAEQTLRNSEDTLPYYFRDRASAGSNAYQRIFSDAFRARYVDYCGPTHTVAVDAGLSGAPTSNPSMSGVSEPGPGSIAIDVSSLGDGEREVAGASSTVTLNEIRTAGVFSSELGASSITISDTGTEATPFVLMLSGPAAGAPMPVTIASDISRPVLIIGYNVAIATPGPISVNGAIILDPRCTVSTASGQLTANHISYHAYSAGVGGFDVAANGTVPATISELAPRVTIVATKGARL